MTRQKVIDTVYLDIDKLVGKDIDSVISDLSDIRRELKIKYFELGLAPNIILECAPGEYEDQYFFLCERMETDIEMATRHAKLNKSKVRHEKEDAKKKESRLRQYTKLKKEFGEKL